MRLKSIKLAGFKSFVDATTVPFSSNMTAIVGPNGCGKSNIIDAVRWVMGESSAKNLRGESMTDVIFNGSTGRQPVGQASIELIFDNTEGRLQGEYAAFTELSIRRKVTREGVSQYYLNGTKCRRRDVTDIFLGTGMGPRSYAIIEQGMISKLIESKPEDLRVYLEEAAGISKYKERRRETENRMRRTQDNLDRLSDIREELGKQLQHLKRQANAAEKYAEFKKEERLTNAKLNTLHWQRLNSELATKQAHIQEYEEQIQDAVLAKNTNENQLDTLRTQIEEAQENFNRIQAKFYQVGTEIATLEQQLQYQKNRLNEQQNLLSQLNTEIEDLGSALTEENLKLDDILIDLETIMIEIEEHEAQCDELSISLETRSRELDAWQTKWEQFNHDNASVRQAAEIAQSKIQQQESRLRELSLREEKLTQEHDTIKQNIDEVDIHDLQEEALIAKEQLDDTEIKIEQVSPSINQHKTEIETLNQNKSNAFKVISEKKAILASLLTLQQGHLADNAEDVSSWFAQYGFENPRKLVELLDVSEGWEQAVEHVLADWLNSSMLDPDALNDGSELLKNIQESRLSINILSTQNLQQECADSKKTCYPTLADHVKGAAYLQDMLSDIHLAGSFDDAVKIRATLSAKQSVITQNGLWMGPGWVKYSVPEDAENSVLIRAKRIQQTQNELAELEQTYSDLENQIDRHEKELSSLQEEYANLNHQKQTQEASIRKLDQIIHSHSAKLDQLQVRLKRNEEDRAEVRLNQEDIAISLEESREVWQESMAKLEENAEEREAFLGEKEQILTNLELARGQLKDAQTVYHDKKMLKQQKQSQQMLLNQSIQRIEIEIEQRHLKINQAQGEDCIDHNMIDELKLQLEGLLESRLSFEEKLKVARESVDQLQTKQRDEELKRNSFESNIASARDALSTLRMDAQALTINQKNVSDKILSDDFQIENMVELLTDSDTENSLGDALTQLANKISRLGSINLAAIEEYQIQSERKAHLDEQNEDLSDALDTLLAAIKKIDKETRIRFKETYDQVNEGLQKLFPKIFGGGNAYLELTDDNLLETGVQIIARPPGKKNATIHLLSGGEKSLTAIALIFAIFELNPAPFCMLDEVDAPLDDANVGRFANIVKEMSDQVQFIYISHNKVSMERAEQLMGVTMHEPGVSRLVSVDIEQAAAMVESV